MKVGSAYREGMSLIKGLRGARMWVILILLPSSPEKMKQGKLGKLKVGAGQITPRAGRFLYKR